MRRESRLDRRMPTNRSEILIQTPFIDRTSLRKRFQRERTSVRRGPTSQVACLSTRQRTILIIAKSLCLRNIPSCKERFTNRLGTLPRKLPIELTTMRSSFRSANHTPLVLLILLQGNFRMRLPKSGITTRSRCLKGSHPSNARLTSLLENLTRVLLIGWILPRNRSKLGRLSVLREPTNQVVNS